MARALLAAAEVRSHDATSQALHVLQTQSARLLLLEACRLSRRPRPVVSRLPRRLLSPVVCRPSRRLQPPPAHVLPREPRAAARLQSGVPAPPARADAARGV